MLNENDLNTLALAAEQAAIAAGAFIQSKYNKLYNTKYKQGGTSMASQVVTEVDIKAQEIILSHLKPTIATFDLGLLTEEAADDQSRLNKSYFWCVDPMDGTLSFTQGRSGYAVSIALITHSGDPVLGVVYIPDLGECYTSCKGQGVTLNDQPFMPQASEGLMHVYLDKDSQLKLPNYKEIIDALGQWAIHQETGRLKVSTELGAVCNAIGVMNAPLSCYFKLPKQQKGGGSIWDFAATRLFFEELGLYVTDASGKRLKLNDANTTYMHKMGVIYTNSKTILDIILTRNQH